MHSPNREPSGVLARTTVLAAGLAVLAAAHVALSALSQSEDPSNAPPTALVESPREGDQVNGTVVVRGTASDPDDDPVTAVEVSIWQDDAVAEDWASANGTANWTFMWNATPYFGTNVSIAVRASDANVTSQPTLVNVTVGNVTERRMNHPPAVTIAGPKGGEVVAGVIVIHGAASDEDVGDRVVAVEVSIEGVLPWTRANGTTAWAFAWNATGAPEGVTAIRARARDASGAVGEAAILVDVDHDATAGQDDAPAEALGITIESPTENATIPAAPLLVRGVVTGAAGREVVVQVRVDEGTFLDVNGSETWNITLDLSSFAPGLHRIDALATDTGTLEEATDMVTVLVWRVRPEEKTTVIITRPTNGSAISGNVTIEGVAFDVDGRPPGHVEVRLGGDWIVAHGVETWNLTFDTRRLAEGPVVVEARPARGTLAGAVATLALVVDNRNEPPVLTVTSPTPGAVVANRLFLDGTVKDPDPGPSVITVEMKLGRADWTPVRFPGEVILDEVDPGTANVTLRATDGEAESGVVTIPILVESTAFAQKASVADDRRFDLPVPATTPLALLAVVAAASLFTARRRPPRAGP